MRIRTDDINKEIEEKITEIDLKILIYGEKFLRENGFVFYLSHGVWSLW